MGRYQTDEEVTALASGEATTEQDADEEPTQAPDEGTADEGDADEAPEGDEEESEEQEEEGEDEDEEDPTVAITVDGQEVQVPLSELRKGYLRTADYTRKTQQLAQLRRQTADAEALRQALERNPHETLKVLARHYEVSEYEPDEDTGPTPEQIRLMELEQWRQTEQSRQQESAVDAEINRLHAEYGDFDDDALFTFAVERGVRDLEVALRAMTFGKSTEARRTEKRKVAAVAGGQGRNGAAHPKSPPERIEKFDDAYQAALRELQIAN
jgi:hypothetical protein